MYHTGRIDILATALEPIVHGAGTSGNAQLMRTQDWFYIDDGKAVRCRVPYVSGNSVKHRLRACAVQYALDAMEVEDRSLSKPEIDLLLSGGHLSKSGAAVDLQTARELEALFPPLSLCGYSAGNAMTESKLRVSNLHMVCRENRERVPDAIRDRADVAPMLALRAGELRSEEMGTRHDQGSKRAGVRYLTDGAQQSIAKKKGKALASPTPDDRGDSAQMIYSFPAIAAGARLWGSVAYADLSDLERAALASAFHYAATERRGDDLVMGVGAKNSIGYGSIKVELAGFAVPPPASMVPDTAIARPDGEVEAYRAHLRGQKSSILDAIRRAVA